MNIKNIKRTVWAEINLDNLISNIKKIRQITKEDTLIASVVKANAYGHGSIGVAKALLEEGIDILAVAMVQEAEELISNNVNAKFLIFGYTPCEYAEYVILNEFSQCVFDIETAKHLSYKACELNKSCNIHIKVDTGMNRLGFKPSEIDIILEISKLPNLNVEGIFTHFSQADDIDKTFTKNQFETFNNVIDELNQKGLDILIKHCSNSAAVVDLDFMNMDLVRVGNIMYGLKPSKDVKIDDLKPVMTFKAKVSHVKFVQKGEFISYGKTFIAEKNMKIAILPVGYADGYTRLLSNKAYVLIKGVRCKVVGNICMDQCMVDVSNLEDVNVGDEVVLFGTQIYEGKQFIIYADELASLIDTINYEIVCMVSRRVPRVYIKDSLIVDVMSFMYS